MGPRLGVWKTDPLATHGEMSMAVVRKPSRRKASGNRLSCVASAPGWQIWTMPGAEEEPSSRAALAKLTIEPITSFAQEVPLMSLSASTK